MAQRGASNKASHNRALRTRSSARSSQPALTTSTSKTTTSSLQRTLLPIFWFSFLFNNIFVSNIFLINSFWQQEVDENNELSKTAWAQELDKHLADKPFQEEQLQQQLPENIQEKNYKKEKLALQEHKAELSGRSACSQQFDSNLLSNKAFSPELWEKEVRMHLANQAACNIQLSHHNQHNTNIELAETQLEKKKNKNKKNNNTASQQLGHQQLRQQQLQLQQLCLQDPASAINRQLPEESLSSTSPQTAAWPAATLTDNLSFSKQKRSAQDLQDNSFHMHNQLANQELVHNNLQKAHAYSILVVEQLLAPTKRALQKQPCKARVSFTSCRRSSRSSSSSLMSTRFLVISALSFDNPNFTNNSSSSLGSGNLNQLSEETMKQQKPIFEKLSQNNLEHILENRQLPQHDGAEQLLHLQLLSNKFFEENFGQTFAENQLQQNLSQDQQQFRSAILPRKPFSSSA